MATTGSTIDSRAATPMPATSTHWPASYDDMSNVVIRGKPSRMNSGSSSTSADPPRRAWPTRWMVESRTSLRCRKARMAARRLGVVDPAGRGRGRGRARDGHLRRSPLRSASRLWVSLSVLMSNCRAAASTSAISALRTE